MKVSNSSGQAAATLKEVASTKTEKSDSKKTSDKKSASSAEIGGSAKLNLSDRAQDIKKAKEVAMATPDVDEAKVAHFQKLIDEGKYKVDAESVADRMVDEHLMMS